MERIRSNELAEHVGKRVRVLGWLASVRNKGAIGFAVVRDGTGTVQAVTSGEVDTGLESVVAVEGTVVSDPQLELHGVTIEVISAVTEQPPVLLAKKALNVPLPTLLDHAMVANRHPTRGLRSLISSRRHSRMTSRSSSSIRHSR
jgi:nondiscriminating aspartyl-tRNA synthetase